MKFIIIMYTFKMEGMTWDCLRMDSSTNIQVNAKNTKYQRCNINSPRFSEALTPRGPLFEKGREEKEDLKEFC